MSSRRSITAISLAAVFTLSAGGPAAAGSLAEIKRAQRLVVAAPIIQYATGYQIIQKSVRASPRSYRASTQVEKTNCSKQTVPRRTPPDCGTRGEVTGGTIPAGRISPTSQARMRSSSA